MESELQTRLPFRINCISSARAELPCILQIYDGFIHGVGSGDGIGVGIGVGSGIDTGVRVGAGIGEKGGIALSHWWC